MKKQSQADMDSLGPPESPEDIPGLMQGMFITQDESGIQTGDPSKNQAHGVLANPVPKSIKERTEIFKKILNQ